MSRAELTRTVEGLQRRMPRHLLSAFCLSLLLLGCACGPAYAADVVWGNRVPLFAPWEETEVPEPEEVGDKMNITGSLDAPSLVVGNGVTFVFSEVRYAARMNVGAKTVSRYIGSNLAYWAVNTTEKNEGNWKTHLALQWKGENHHYIRRAPTTIIRGNKIYLFALNQRGPDGSQDPDRWHLELGVGEITGGLESKRIEWGSSESLRSNLSQAIEEKKLTLLLAFDHSAFLTSKGTIVFSVYATNNKKETGLAVMQLKDGEEQWEVSFVEKPRTCTHNSFFEWDERLVSVISDCDEDEYHARQYDEGKKEWDNFNATSFLLPKAESRTNDFITVSIENKTVLFFTETFKRGMATQVYLRFSDGDHVRSAGEIAYHDSNIVSGGLVYTNGELFFPHFKENGVSFTLLFKRLDHQLRSIRYDLGIPEKKDGRLVGQTGLPSPTALPQRSFVNASQPAAPETSTGPSPSESQTPTDPQEDSSEHVRMGASLLILLGLRALALLFSASI